MADTSNLNDYLSDIADAIRAKKGTSSPINANSFDIEIASIPTGGTSDATVTVNDVVNPATFYNASGTKQVGAIIPNYDPDTMQEFTVTESADNDIGCDGLLYIHKVNTTVTLYRTDTNEVVDTFTVENSTTYPRFAYVGIDVTNGKLFNIFWDNVNHDTDRNYTYVRRVFVSNDKSTINLLNEAYDGYSAYISSSNYPNGWEDNYGKVYPHPSNPHVLAKMVAYRQDWGRLELYNIDKTTITKVESYDTGVKNLANCFWANDELFCGQANETTNTLYCITCAFSGNFISSSTFSSIVLSDNAYINTDGTYIISNKILYQWDKTVLATLSDLPSYMNMLVNLKDGLHIFSIVLGGTKRVYDYLLNTSDYTLTYKADYSSTISSYPTASARLIVEPQKITPTNTTILMKIGTANSTLLSLMRNNTMLYNPVGANVSSADIVKGKIAYGNNGKVIGSLEATTINITPSMTTQNINNGYYENSTVESISESHDYRVWNATAEQVLNTPKKLIPGFKVFYKNSVTDLSSNHLNGTLTGPYTIADDGIIFGGGYGSTGAINKALGTWEIGGTINSDFVPVDSAIWYNCSCIMGCELGGTQQDFGIILNSAGKVGIGYGFSSCEFTNINVLDGQYHHYALTVTTTQLLLYVDGVLALTVNATRLGTVPTTFGIYWNNAGYGTPVRGKFNIFRFYENALTASEIENNYFAGLTTEVQPVYTELEYVEFTGTQYLDTLIIPSNHEANVDYEVDTYYAGDHLFGTDVTSDYNYYSFTFDNNKYYWGTNSSQTYGGTWSSGRHLLKFNTNTNYKVILDNTELGTANSTSSGNLLIGKSHDLGLHAKIYSFKLYNNISSDLVLDLIPVKDENNVICFYDTVSGTYFNNEGTGDFVAGPIKEGPSLTDNLNEILNERETKVLPENIAEGVTMFNVTGALSSGYVECNFSTLGTDSYASNRFVKTITKIRNIVLPSSVVSLNYFLSNDSNDNILGRLESFDTFDTSHVTNFGVMCYYDYYLKTVPYLDTSNGTNFSQMFLNCVRLENIPVFNFSSCLKHGLERIFSGCTSLTNTSLQNILKSLLTLPNDYEGTKTLKYIGLTSAQATTCTGFTEWTTLSTNGWTTGYES